MTTKRRGLGGRLADLLDRLAEILKASKRSNPWAAIRKASQEEETITRDRRKAH